MFTIKVPRRQLAMASEPSVQIPALSVSISSARKAVMRRSSESIACLAAALAKAQAELTNPEKSLVATIGPNGPGEAERSFRYAPLSSGLEIVRKTLGQHEIATVRTTAIDQTVGFVNLTTVLGACLGEWMRRTGRSARSARLDTAADGSAPTYARRYALFSWLALPGTTISMRPISRLRRPPRRLLRGRHRMSMLA
jgi:hypothetical protein